MPDKQMTLEQFKDLLHQEADRFYEEWKKSEKRNPEQYAHKMTEAEWWEQHIAWSDMGELE